MSEEKNRKIKESSKATRERHSNMDCRVISTKIQENRLSRALSLAREAVEKLPDVREEYQRNLSVIRISKMDIERAEKANKKLEEKYGALVK